MGHSIGEKAVGFAEPAGDQRSEWRSRGEWRRGNGCKRIAVEETRALPGGTDNAMYALMLILEDPNYLIIERSKLFLIRRSKKHNHRNSYKIKRYDRQFTRL